jgi:seryl-tRNA synthetase
MPGVNEYREISSVSTVRDFQSRRMKARYKDDSNDKHFVYTYNGSALAIERTIAAIIENYVNEQGVLEVPKALQSYVDFKTI